MKKNNCLKKMCVVSILSVAVFLAASSASALDAYQDRRGIYAGLGIGGGATFLVPGGDPGAWTSFELQLGGGATQNLTIGLNFNTAVHMRDGTDDVIVSFTPGPELHYFFGKTGFFMGFKTGAVLGSNHVDDESEFVAGFDAGLSAGYEFFVNSNWAMSLAMTGDYMLLSKKDSASIGFAFRFTYY